MRASNLENGKTYIYNRCLISNGKSWHWIEGFDPNEPCSRSADRGLAKKLWEKGIRDVQLEHNTLLLKIGGWFEGWSLGASGAHFRILTGTYAGRTIAISHCYGIEEASRDSSAIREHQAAFLEVDVQDWKQQIKHLEAEIESHKQNVNQAESKIHLLRSYASDEEALAALLSKILQSGGEESEILNLLRAYAGTSKL